MKRVLVVDDEPAIRNLERAILKSAGYRVLTAENGLEALKLIEAEEPDVIILDVEMPVMDGISLFRALDQFEERPAVVVVTCDDALKIRRKLGAESALAKPFSPDDLIRRVDALGRSRALIGSGAS